MISRIRKFAALSAADRRLLCEAVLRLLAASMAVRFSSPLRLASKFSAPGHRQPSPVHSAERITWAVEAAARLLRARCLTTSVAASALLRRYGYPAIVRIGVHTRTGNLKAHAWVEMDGRVLSGGDTAEFRPLTTSPA